MHYCRVPTEGSYLVNLKDIQIYIRVNFVDGFSCRFDWTLPAYSITRGGGATHFSMIDISRLPQIPLRKEVQKYCRALPGFSGKKINYIGLNADIQNFKDINYFAFCRLYKDAKAFVKQKTTEQQSIKISRFTMLDE